MTDCLPKGWTKYIFSISSVRETVLYLLVNETLLSIWRQYLLVNETLLSHEEKLETVLKKIKTVWSRGDVGASRGRGGADDDRSLGENLIALLCYKFLCLTFWCSFSFLKSDFLGLASSAVSKHVCRGRMSPQPPNQAPVKASIYTLTTPILVDTQGIWPSLRAALSPK